MLTEMKGDDKQWRVMINNNFEGRHLVQYTKMSITSDLI